MRFNDHISSEFILVILFILETIIAIDPCLPRDYMELNDPKRSLQYNASSGLCDEYLPKGWYKPINTVVNDMPTECIQGGYRCGTVNPIWMNGVHPAINETSNVTTCVANSNGDCCSSLYVIQVKNCYGDFYVYYLNGTDGCNQAYCFGTETSDTQTTEPVIMLQDSSSDIADKKRDQVALAFVIICSMTLVASLVALFRWLSKTRHLRIGDNVDGSANIIKVTAPPYEQLLQNNRNNQGNITGKPMHNDFVTSSAPRNTNILL